MRLSSGGRLAASLGGLDAGDEMSGRCYFAAL
jgi:hypothetical protein